MHGDLVGAGKLYRLLKLTRLMPEFRLSHLRTRLCIELVESSKHFLYYIYVDDSLYEWIITLCLVLSVLQRHGGEHWRDEQRTHQQSATAT